MSRPPTITSRPPKITSRTSEITSRPRKITSRPRQITSRSSKITSRPRTPRDLDGGIGVQAFPGGNTDFGRQSRAVGQGSSDLPGKPWLWMGNPGIATGRSGRDFRGRDVILRPSQYASPGNSDVSCSNPKVPLKKPTVSQEYPRNGRTRLLRSWLRLWKVRLHLNPTKCPHRRKLAGTTVE
eukprot:gene23425-biopygen10337